ncbi:hypothetical protein BZA70DRAFT_270677 [Myxozyma melibiosi]|uniref:Uncharacterized protein n=1 Tax=Myxozyma melibiosi TaxID=54550 RepID=A0ABR1FDQ0_9ASCO
MSSLLSTSRAVSRHQSSFFLNLLPTQTVACTQKRFKSKAPRLEGNDQIYLLSENVVSMSGMPTALSMGVLTDTKNISESTFTPNPRFPPIMHATIAKYVEEDPTFTSLASMYGNDFMAIYDQRSPPPYGRTPEVEDILGMVKVQNGVIVPRSYEKNNMYRFATPVYGLTRLTHFLFLRVKEACEKAHEW